ncbi:mitochondrial inner membrane protease subunit [Parastagonospora nodorum]|nr:mitochondrial inner membrane protease subunit [Parastagonospora nodorum]KAH6285406.1 mitochondrial inner membrane protease subunit [Parastagonospora nodorum]
MPPKPRIRVPVRATPAARGRAAQSPPSNPPTLASETSTTPRTASTVRTIARYGFYGVTGVCMGLSIRDNLFDFDKVSGASMAPTINPTVHETGRRDVVFVRPYLHGRNSNNTWDIERGDVVTFWKPHKPEEVGLKRVIALEGDTVYPKSGSLLNAAANRLAGMPDGLADSDPDSILSGREEKGKVVVPYGHVWVEGDNWRSSLDSRDIGPISKSLVMGKVFKVWRGWGELRGTEDSRTRKEKEGASRVKEGQCEVPGVFL